MREFNPEELKKLYQPQDKSTNEDNGLVTIIGGSSLFHGAPILALKVATRIVDIVFFASPDPSVGRVAEQLKSKLASFIWVPWEEVGEYIKKSDAVLIGPGLMRYRSEKKRVANDQAGRKTKEITEKLLTEFPNKQWVIDAGSLQVMDPKFIPPNAILTPNQKEYRLLFGEEKIETMARKYNCIIVFKGPENRVCSSQESVLIKGGNAGLTKGGTGDVLAGLTVALAAKNPPLLAACAASFLAKKAADQLFKKVGFAYNADDLAEEIPRAMKTSFT